MEPSTEQQEVAPPTPEVALAPTQDVGTFWERLDQVLALNVESARMREKVESLLEEFPDTAVSGREYKSAIFQPERIALSSSDDANIQPASLSVVVNTTDIADTHRKAEYFSQFRIQLRKPLRGVKSFQLISASIPNATIMIPDNQLIFFYYRIQSLANSSTFYNPTLAYQQGSVVSSGGIYYGAYQNAPIGTLPTNTAFWYNFGANGARPNYFQLTAANLQFVRLKPTASPNLPETQPANLVSLWNHTFQDVQDLVNSLNLAATGPIANVASVANDITFQYNPTLNRVVFFPINVANYFYIPCGYEDPNIDLYVPTLSTPPGNVTEIPDFYKPGYILNSRLGFTWNGKFIDPFSTNPYQSVAANVALYMRPADPGWPIFNTWNQNIITAQSYADLVFSSVCRIYTDITLGSTDDSQSEGNLLSVVPMNANNLGIAYYQNAFNCPLTKVPETITSINIRLITDAGDPFYLPNSAVVNLELAITYK